ncbi:MAG: branched-chain amino acid transporter ATPase [Ilumatobacteraceae bacterium]|nr:branched-chain amino acid transporter ATPase [Ilumatobacteraceae bacterium]MCU1389584.1 branched-chain amino acid transporter ATPase [Ilumatobacteraceae bacterium]
MTATLTPPATADTAMALELRDVTAGYSGTTVLRNIDLAIPVGVVTALLGPNGAGKSTLLKTVSGLIRPTSGSVHLDGVDVSKFAPFQRAALGLCHIPEGRGVFRSLTVRENLRLQAQPGTEAEATERCIAAFPILGERIGQIAGTLSGGQQQMLAMCRAYARSPRLVLVDEASLGLAPIVVDEIFTFLATITAEGSSLLIVDQFVSRALAMASTAYLLARGEIAFAGTSAELRDGDMFQRYLGGDA